MTPWRKGSVFDSLMRRRAEVWRKDRSWNSRVDSRSKAVFRDAVYSETRRKPKNAVVIAAHNMILSSNKRDELNKFLLIILKSAGVMGKRFGKE